MDIIYLGRYCTDAILGGPEKVARRIYDNYTINNKSIFIEYFFDGKKHGIFKKLFGKETIKNINESKIYRMGVLRILITLLKYKPKIIHIITFERFAVVSFFCKLFFDVRIIFNMHGLIIHENKYFRKTNPICYLKDKIAEEILVKYSNTLLILSRRFKTLLESYYAINEKKIKYIKNGVDAEYFKNEKMKMSNKNDIVKMVFIADIYREEKGFSFLKNSLESIEKAIELHIIDKKNNTIDIKNKLIKVYYYDKMPPFELSDFLKDKDVFISASNYEPFGISCAECISAGLIPVLTKETGVSELIIDGVNGFLYDYGDTEKLCNIINELAEDNLLRNRIAQETVKITDELGWEKITEEYYKIYNSILLTG
jgi:glycosyltransferase involved in cell wall biosynthesis